MRPFVLPGAVVIFFLLVLAGMTFMALGLVANEAALIIFGGLFMLLTAVGFRSRLPFKVLKSALVGALLGAMVGTSAGSLARGIAEPLAGLLGGAIAGAFIGGMGVTLLISLITSIPIGPLSIQVFRLPNVISVPLLIIGAIIGAAIGATELREGLPRVFGPVIGGALVGGFVGMVAGTLLAARTMRSFK